MYPPDLGPVVGLVSMMSGLIHPSQPLSMGVHVSTHRLCDRQLKTSKSLS